MMGMVSRGTSSAGVWSRKVRLWAIGLTAAGVCGVVIGFCGGTSAYGAHLTAGWGGGIGLLFVVLFIFAVIAGFVGAFAVAGAILLWFRSVWGVLLLIPVNLLSLYLIAGSQNVYAGQVVWGAVVVLLAAIPVIAIGVLLWPLWTRGNGLVLGLQLLVL